MAKMKVSYRYSDVGRESKNHYYGLSLGRVKRMARNIGATLRIDGYGISLCSPHGTHLGMFVKGTEKEPSLLMFWPNALKDGM